MRHHPLRAEIGHGHHRAAVGHQLGGPAGHVDEGVAGDVQRVQEIASAGVGIAPGQLGLVGIGDGMDQEVDRAPGVLQLAEDGIQAVGALDVGIHDMGGTQALGQRAHPALEGVALIGEGHLGPLHAQRLRNAPGDGVAVGHPHDQAALAVHNSGHHSAHDHTLIRDTGSAPGCSWCRRSRSCSRSRCRARHCRAGWSPPARPRIRGPGSRHWRWRQ